MKDKCHGENGLTVFEKGNTSVTKERGIFHTVFHILRYLNSIPRFVLSLFGMSNSFLRLFSCGLDCQSQNTEDSIENNGRRHQMRRFFRGRRRNAERTRTCEAIETNVDAIQTHESTAAEGFLIAKQGSPENVDICRDGQGDSSSPSHKNITVPSPTESETSQTNCSLQTIFCKKFAPVHFNPQGNVSPSISPQKSQSIVQAKTGLINNVPTISNKVTDRQTTVRKSVQATRKFVTKTTSEESNIFQEPLQLPKEPIFEATAGSNCSGQDANDSLTNSSVPFTPVKTNLIHSVSWKNKTFRPVTPNFDTTGAYSRNNSSKITTPAESEGGEKVSTLSAKAVTQNAKFNSPACPTATQSSQPGSNIGDTQSKISLAAASGPLNTKIKATPPKVPPKPVKKLASVYGESAPTTKPVLTPDQLATDVRQRAGPKRYDTHYPNPVQEIVNKLRGQSPLVAPKPTRSTTKQSTPVTEQPKVTHSASTKTPILSTDKQEVQEPRNKPKPPTVMVKPTKGANAGTRRQKDMKRVNDVFENDTNEIDDDSTDSDESSSDFTPYYPNCRPKSETCADGFIHPMARLNIHYGNAYFPDRSKPIPMPHVNWQVAKQQEKLNINQSANTILSMLVQEHNCYVTEKERVEIPEFETKENVGNATKQESLSDTDKMFKFMEQVPPALIVEKLDIFMNKTKLHKKEKPERVYSFLLRRLHQYLIVVNEIIQGGRQRTTHDIHALFKLEQHKLFLYKQIFEYRQREPQQKKTTMVFDKFRTMLEASLNRQLEQEYASYKKRRSKKPSDWNDGPNLSPVSHNHNESMTNQGTTRASGPEISSLHEESKTSSPPDKDKVEQRSKGSIMRTSHWDKSPGKSLSSYRQNSFGFRNTRFEAGKTASRSTSSQPNVHKGQPVPGANQILPPVALATQEPGDKTPSLGPTIVTQDNPNNDSCKKADEITTKKKKRDKKWRRSKSVVKDRKTAEFDSISERAYQDLTSEPTTTPERPALQADANDVIPDVNWPPCPSGDPSNYLTFAMDNHPENCDVCGFNRSMGGIDGLVNSGLDKHAIFKRIQDNRIYYHQEATHNSLKDQLGRPPTKMEFYRYTVDGYVHIPIKQLPKQIQEMETLTERYEEEEEERDDIVDVVNEDEEVVTETPGDRRRRMRKMRPRRFRSHSGAVENFGNEDQPLAEPQPFIPDGATFNFSSLEVGPGHGDRPNKRKIQEVLKEKIKTKGEPNKHLIKETSDFSMFYNEYLDDDDEDDDVIDDKPSVMGGDGPEGEGCAEAPLPLLATELLQFSDDREFNMVPEEIIRKEDETKLKDIEDKYTPTKKTTPNKRNKSRKDGKKNVRNVTLDFFN